MKSRKSSPQILKSPLGIAINDHATDRLGARRLKQETFWSYGPIRTESPRSKRSRGLPSSPLRNTKRHFLFRRMKTTRRIYRRGLFSRWLHQDLSSLAGPLEESIFWKNTGSSSSVYGGGKAGCEQNYRMSDSEREMFS